MKATDKKDTEALPKYFWNDSEIDEGTHNKLMEEHRLWVIAEEKKSEAHQAALAAAATKQKNSEAKKKPRRK
jgi:hypothetical protein